MFTFNVRNVSEALFVVNQSLKDNGVLRETRNGPALEFPAPVAVSYSHPKERVLFYPQRDANPFFHFMESLWMLAGRRDVEFVQRYNNRMSVYSDNGVHFHGAYGYRWKNWFEDNQLDTIIARLKEYPNDRRCVLSMWDPDSDLTSGNHNVDLPCNTHIYFRVEETGSLVPDVLHMTVCNRSNDMIWGALGANAVHMSFLQEYMAEMVGVEVGTYVQFSNNFHAYLDTLPKLDGMAADYEPYLHLPEEGKTPVPLVTDTETFEEELVYFMTDKEPMVQRGYDYLNDIFPYVAEPMREAWQFWKSPTKEVGKAIQAAEKIQSADWRVACCEWLQRRVPMHHEMNTLAPEEEWGCASAQKPKEGK